MLAYYKVSPVVDPPEPSRLVFTHIYKLIGPHRRSARWSRDSALKFRLLKHFAPAELCSVERAIRDAKAPDMPIMASTERSSVGSRISL